MDFRVRPRDKTPKSGVPHCKLSPSQDSENEQIQNQIDVNFFLQSGDRTQGICATRTNCQSNFLPGILERLRKRVARVRPGIAGTWMLHHDNATCHTANSINYFLAEKSIPVVGGFKTFAVFRMQSVFFWEFPRRLKFKSRRFGTQCRFHRPGRSGIKCVEAR